MNLIDAIKSGKRFKREGWSDTGWMEPTGSFGFTVESMIADDWEVESEPVTITREDFDAAWKKVWPNDPQFEYERNLIAEELGL